MKLFQKAFNFFIFSSLFIAVCAIVMVWQVNDLLHLSYDHMHFGLFVFSSTVCSYNFHWLLTRESHHPSIRLEWTLQHQRLHKVLMVLSGLLAVYAGIFFLRWWPWFGLAAFLTFLYSAPKIPVKLTGILKEIAIGKTLFLTFVWTYVTTVLPIILGSDRFHSNQLLFCLSRFFLIYAICILFDLRDRESDKAEGIRSLITYLSEQHVRWLFYVTLMCFVICTLFLSFSPALLAALLLPGIITAFLYRRDLHRQSDYFFYFLLDGLMMGSGLLTWMLN